MFNRRFTVAIKVLVAFALFAARTNAEEAEKPLPRVLLIGDSISGGYTNGVIEMLKGEADVRRIPGNGQHTGTGLEKLDQWLGDEPWDVIHFNWGLWDLCYRHPESKVQGRRDKVRGTITCELPRYEKNLRELVRRLKATDAKLIWAATTPVPPDEAGRFEGDAAKYNAAAAKIMAENDIAINDLHTFILPRMKEVQVAPGNVHFTREGSKLLAEQVVKSIRGQLRDE
jgi:hypothetical protein